MSINNIPTFYDSLQYAAYETQTDYIEYLIGLNRGTTGSVGPVGPTGPTGPAGGGTASTWIEENLIQAPPIIQYGVPIIKSTVIYIPWTNYSQINAGFIGYLPLANDFQASISANTITGTYDINEPVDPPYNLDSVTGPHGSIEARGLSGVVLYKTPGTNSIQNITFPGETTARRVYVYYNVALYEAEEDGNTITASYLNYYNDANSNSLVFDGYLDSNGPSAVIDPTIDITGSTGATFNFQAPERVDVGDSASTLTIIDYEIEYSTDGSIYRYPEPLEELNTVNTGETGAYGLTGSYKASDLYPDSPYTYTIIAENSDTKYGLTGATAPTESTRPLDQATMGDLSFPNRYYSAPGYTILRIGGATAISNLVKDISSWSSPNFSAPIQNTQSRGNITSSDEDVMNLSANLNGAMGPAVIFKGFGSDVPTGATVNNLTIGSISISDSYATSPVYYQGFFQKSTSTLTIESGAFTASGNVFKFTVTDENLKTSTSVSKTHEYYYDGIASGPTGNMTYQFGGTITTTLVSGVHVLGGTGTTISTSTNLSNMGTYFYASPYLRITSTLPNLCQTTEPALTDISVGYSGAPNYQFLPTIQINNKSVATNSFEPIYATSITLAAVASNVGSTAGVSVSPPIPTIIDGASYKLVKTILPSSIPNLGNNSAIIGYRVYSATVPGTAGTPYFTYNNDNTTPYSTIPYNQSWDISSTGPTGAYNPTSEIMIYRGKFSAKGVPGAYINYTTYLYANNTFNTVNYANILSTGYRYATFVWKINTSTTDTYDTLKIILNNVTSDPDISFDVYNGVASIGGSPLQVFYRFENSARLTPSFAGIPIKDFTTIWADGNSVTGNPFSAATYYGNPPNPPDYNSVCSGLDGSIVITEGNSGDNLTYSVLIPSFLVSAGTNEYLYCRVGLPMGANIAYQYVSANLSILST